MQDKDKKEKHRQIRNDIRGSLHNYKTSHSDDRIAQPQPPPFIEDAISSDAKYRLRFIVKDYGKGIAQEDFSQIFQPFQQAHIHCRHGDTGKHEGTGLGLAITSRLVNGLGGAITVDSELGKWTEFSVDLPLLVGEAPKTPSPVKKSYDIEDISSMAQKLQQHNTRIIFVTNHSEMLMIEDFAKQNHFECIKYSTCQDLSRLTYDDNDIDGDDYYHSDYGQLFQSKTNVCIVQEDLYDEKMYKMFVKNGPSSKTMLFTYGPKYSVKECHMHYCSMFRTIPSVIVCSILNFIEDKDHTSCLLRQSNSGRKLNHSYDSIIQTKSGSFPTISTPTFPSNISPTSETAKKSVDIANYENLHVLIAEDNVINQKVLSQMLYRIGIKHIEIVDNGLEAVKATEKKHFDVLLLDMEMPVMGGLEASRIIVVRYDTHIISNTNNNKKPHIAFVTAHASYEYEELAKEAGGSDFISKPFSLQVIKNFFQSLHMKV